jgi:hypothetical protein
MANLYVGVEGEKLYIDLGEDISTYSAQMILKPPCGNLVTKTATIGVVNLDTEIGLLLANQYIYYSLLEDDLYTDGQWNHRAVLTATGEIRKSNWVPFRVGR